MLGPLALATEDGLYTIAPCLASSKLHSGSSFLEGALLPNIAFLNSDSYDETVKLQSIIYEVPTKIKTLYCKKYRRTRIFFR